MPINSAYYCGRLQRNSPEEKNSKKKKKQYLCKLGLQPTLTNPKNFCHIQTTL